MIFSRDTATPTHAYVLAYDQHHLRDACLAPPRPEWGGARALYAVLDTGRVFAADVEPDDNELFGRKSTVQTAKEVYLDLHDALSLPPRLFTGAGCAHGLLYSSRAHALVIARDGCAACVIPLGDGVRDVRGGGHILPCTVPPPPRRPQVSRPPTGSAAADELLLAALNASQTQQKTAQQPFGPVRSRRPVVLCAFTRRRMGGFDDDSDAIDVVCVCVARGCLRRLAHLVEVRSESCTSPVLVSRKNLLECRWRAECDCTEPGPAPPASTAAQRLAAATGGSTTPQHRRVLGVCVRICHLEQPSYQAGSS